MTYRYIYIYEEGNKGRKDDYSAFDLYISVSEAGRLEREEEELHVL